MKQSQQTMNHMNYAVMSALKVLNFETFWILDFGWGMLKPATQMEIMS